MLSLFSDYGDVAKFRGLFTVYQISHPEYVKQILTKAWPQFTKNTIDYRVISATLGRGLVTNDGPDWRTQRNLMQPVFANRNIDGFDSIINDVTDSLCAEWDNCPEGTQRWLDRDMSRITFQVVSRTLFGANIDNISEEMVDILEEVNQHPLSLSSLLHHFVSWLPLPSNRRFVKVKRRLDEIVMNLIELHRNGGGTTGDIVDRLLAAQQTPNAEDAMDDNQMLDEIITLMLAGHETSATTLTWTFYLLSQNPDVEQRLLEELQRVLNGRPATSADLSHLPYLKQVVQESMRVRPPVWGIARKCSEAIEFGDYLIPSNSYLAIPIYVLHRHPDFWEQAERFDPDRFSPREQKNRHSYAYLPFAGGPRTCIGANMAMLETQLILSRLVQQYEITPVKGHPVVPAAVVTLKTRDGLPVTIKQRS